MPNEKTLRDAFYEILNDFYFAERQSVKACRNPRRRQFFRSLNRLDHHTNESANQVERLVQVFELLGKPARAKTCGAMHGIEQELKEDSEVFGGTAVADAVVIGCGQVIEFRGGALRSIKNLVAYARHGGSRVASEPDSARRKTGWFPFESDC